MYFDELYNNSKKARSEKEQFEFALKGRQNADYQSSTYSEYVVENTKSSKEEINLFGMDFGDFLDFNELELNETFNKLVLFKSYSTSTNRYDESKSDIIFDFVDRNGLPIRSRTFSGLDTSNRLTRGEKLNALQGNVVWLKGKLIKKGGRFFIEVLHITECEQLIGRTKELNLFFQQEIEDWLNTVNCVKEKIRRFQLADLLIKQHEPLLVTAPVKGVFERKGAYMKYLEGMLATLEVTGLEDYQKDLILSYDILYELKRIVQDPLSLPIEVKNLLIRFSNKDQIELYIQIVSDVLLNKYENDDILIYKEIHKGFRNSIMNSLLLKDWVKYKVESIYSPQSKKMVSLRREG